MAWKPPEDDEILNPAAPPAPAAGPAAAWAPPAEDEIVRSPLGTVVSALHTGDVTPPALPEGIPAKVSSYLQRVMKAHNPFPTSMDDVKGIFEPSPGKVGAGRFLEEEGKRVGEAVRGAGYNMAEAFAEAPGLRQFPEVAGRVAAFGISAPIDLLSDTLTPSGAAQGIGGDAAVSAIKGAAMAARARGAEKVSGLPPHVSRAVRENPEFFETTQGTPEALEASNAALKGIIDSARAGHIADRTMAREFIRPIELADVESGVRDIQGVIKGARKTAGAAIQAEKEKLGFTPLDEQAKLIAERGLPEKMDDAALIREALGLLRKEAPRGPESIEPLVGLRQAIDDRINFGARDINPPGTKMEAILKDLRAKINERIGGPMEGDLERSVMGVPTGNRLPDTYAGAPLRAAEQEFARVARITDPLTKKFDTVPKGVSAVKTSMQEGLRSVDPELRALEDLAGGGDALARAEGAEARFLEGEQAFKKDLKRFDPVAQKFETTPKGMDTVRGVMREGTEAVDPDMKAIKAMPKGEEALNRLKAEVNRFDAERVDVKPDSTAEMVAQVVGITPQRAAKWLSMSVHGGDRFRVPFTDAQIHFPALSRAAAVLGQVAARGPEALATTNFLLQQQDDEYRQAIQAMQQGGQP